MAFGKMRLIDFAAEPEQVKEAMRTLLKKNRRTGCKNPQDIKIINLYVIECDWEDVSGKTETPVRKPEDVPFVDVYSVPEDNEPFDISDLLREREDKIRNKKYLGYLDE